MGGSGGWGPPSNPETVTAGGLAGGVGAEGGWKKVPPPLGGVFLPLPGVLTETRPLVSVAGRFTVWGSAASIVISLPTLIFGGSGPGSGSDTGGVPEAPGNIRRLSPKGRVSETCASGSRKLLICAALACC